MKTIPQAIATMEGFYSQGSRPQRNNSPGDLIYGPEAIAFGSYENDGKYAMFDTPRTGWRALVRWLEVPARFSAENPGDGRPLGPSGYLVGGYLGATLAQALWRFAPPADGNNASNYLSFVENETGHQGTDILTAAMLVTPETT